MFVQALRRLQAFATLGQGDSPRWAIWWKVWIIRHLCDGSIMLWGSNIDGSPSDWPAWWTSLWQSSLSRESNLIDRSLMLQYSAMVVDFPILPSPRQPLISGSSNWWNGNGCKLQTSKCLFRTYIADSMSIFSRVYVQKRHSHWVLYLVDDYWRRQLCQESRRLLLHVATVFEGLLMQCQLIWRKVQFLPASFGTSDEDNMLFLKSDSWNEYMRRNPPLPLPSKYPFPKYSWEMGGAAGSGSIF